jgi:DNA invertase Pin-like site-specific DNA recombinase
MTRTLKTFALYARLSVNPDGTKDSVATQLAAGRDYIANRWPGAVIVEFFDDGISASKEDTIRPDYEKMLAAIKAGEVDAVVSRWQARISRNEEIWPRFKRICLAAGIDVLNTWLEGDIPLGAAQSLGGDVGNLMNARQAKLTQAAVLDTLNRRAIDGRPNGGRPYGYKHQRDEAGVSQLVIVPEQAAVIEDMARMILAGYSLADVARHLNERKVPTARGGKAWEPSAIRKIITKPVIAGWRTHNGEITAPGTWKRILPDDTWRAVRHQLDNPRKVTRSDGVVVTRKPGRRPARRYLLTCGPALCGRCGAELIAQRRSGKRCDAVPMYLCSSNNGGCNGLSIVAEPTEAHVGEVLKVYLSNNTAVDKLMALADTAAAQREALEVERQAIEQRRDEAAERAAEGEISVKMATTIDAKCEAALAKLDAKIDAIIVPEGKIDYRTIGMTWDDLPLAEKRATLFDLHCSVEVVPAFGSRAFNPGRLIVRFGSEVWSLSGKGQRPSATA